VLTNSSASVTVFLNDPQLTQEHAEMTSSHDKCSVLTNSSAGVAVFLNDLQLTQEHAEMTSSHGQTQVHVQDVELLPQAPWKNNIAHQLQKKKGQRYQK
jgi:hypothetical protein